MNTRSNVIVMTSAMLLLGLAWTGNSMAQQRGSAMPDPGTDRASCSEVEWHRDMRNNYPWVADACHEAVVVNGQKWARFEAEFQQLNRDGSIDSNFRDTRGRSLGSVSLQPASDQRVLLDGRSTRFSELRRGQVLNFYAPEGEFSFSTAPGASAAEQVQIVQRQDDQGRDDQRQLSQSRDARRQDEQRRDGQSSRELGQADRSTSQRRDTLPATAGPLPILALGGMLSLLGGITLSMRRRLFTKNS